MASKHSKSIFDFKGFFVACVNLVSKKVFDVPIPFKIIIFVLIASLVLSLVFVGNVFLPGISHKNMLKKASDTFQTNKSKVALELLSQQNPDIKAWLKIDETAINYAVCQGKNDSYYLNHNQRGKKSRYGAIMMLANDDITRKNGDKNIVIFGNNMKDGTMFGSLKEYRKLEYFKAHPSMKLFYGKSQENYVIFSVMLVSSVSDDSGYKPYKSYFANEEDFNTWYTETRSRSIINTTVKAEYGDDLLTLVTVANDFDGARLVVMAKKVDDWNAERVDVTAATINSHIKYPKIWYENKGVAYPY